VSLTEAEAAELLGLSRPFVVRLPSDERATGTGLFGQGIPAS
jgi:hypothetical protein